MQDKKSDVSDENIIDEHFLDSDLDSKIREVIEDNPLGELSEPTYEELIKEQDTLKDRLMRSLADLENLRKRSERDRKDAELYGGTKLARDLLSVFDNMSRALENIDDDLREKASALAEGLELTQRELLSVFLRHKIDQIEPKEGDKFDPKYHQAMFEAPISGTEKGTIIQVMTKGFKIGDRLLRASQVGVSSNSASGVSSPKENKELADESIPIVEGKL
jgi:molecular chaperone GrpE